MSKSNLKVALTGGIASVKSQVSALLEGHGCFIIDLDVIAREVVAPGTAGLNELIENFGNSKLDEVFIPSFDCRWNFVSSIMNS